jgi:hypothetical protein
VSLRATQPHLSCKELLDTGLIYAGVGRHHLTSNPQDRLVAVNVEWVGSLRQSVLGGCL